MEVCSETFQVLKECLEAINCSNLCAVDEIAPEDQRLAEGHTEHRARHNANSRLKGKATEVLFSECRASGHHPVSGKAALPEGFCLGNVTLQNF